MGNYQPTKNHTRKTTDVPNGLVCKVCGRHSMSDWKGMFCHISRMHNMDSVSYVYQYYDKTFDFQVCGWCNRKAIPVIQISDKWIPSLAYVDKFVCGDRNCIVERKRHNPKSYYAVQRTYKLSEEDARKRVQETSPFHRAFYDNEEQYMQFQSNTSLSSFIRKYGEQEGKQRYEKHTLRWKNTCGSESAYIKRFGIEKGKQIWARICKEKAITRDKMIKKYGDKEGNKRYEDFLDKTLKNFVSAVSIEWLDEVSKRTGLNIRHGKNSTEKKIRCSACTRPVDGYNDSENIVFEFYGNNWHMNPRTHRGTDTNPRGVIASDVWKHDYERVQQIIPHVAAIFICWEWDWHNRKEEMFSNLQSLLCKLKEGNLPKGAYYL